VKKKRLSRKVKLTLLLIGAVFAFSLLVRLYNLHRFHLEEQTRFMMDTFVTIYAVGPQKVTSRAIDLALDRMQEVDAKFNILNRESPLYAFNHEGVPISDPEIVHVIRVALQVAHDSNGAFDITVEPLIALWGFYGDSPDLPEEGKIKDCLTKINYAYLSIKDGKLEKRDGNVRIDLGGIAKGYGVSQAVSVLKAEGVTSALIDAGGDVYALGKKGSKLWNVGVRHPREEDLLGYIEVEDLAVLGSGDYERFFVKNGKRYHHIIDPKIGYPAEGLSGITLIHPDPVVADAWNTALFVLGPEKGLDIVEKTSGMETIMVTTSGEVLYSSGFKDRLKRISKME
jgi:thiamine biosynthesis lipoprotein